MRKRTELSSFVIVLIFMTFTKGTAIAQSYGGPSDFHGPVKLAIPLPVNYPPVRTDMPLDVLKGYIYFDSMMHINVHQWQIDSMVNTMYDSDTLRTILKYAYEMIDYDPVAFFQYLYDSPRTGVYRKRAPRGVLLSILDRIAKVIPDSGQLFASLTHVDAILQVAVFDTSSVPDWTVSGSSERCNGVMSWVHDVIKGQNLIGCVDTGQLRTKHSKASPQSGVPSCIAFQYWDHWLSNIQIPIGVTAERRNPWFTPGNEYIVFLSFTALGADSANDYATLGPGLATSSVMGAYPIQSGIVYDPNDDFGFGTGLTVDAFKAKLRQKIASITSYHP